MSTAVVIALLILFASKEQAWAQDGIQPANVAAETILERRVSFSADDAEENLDTGSVSTVNGDLELGFDGAISQTVGMRFRTIDIPPGATIVNAYLQFTVVTGTLPSANTADLTIRGEAVDNAVIFDVTASSISSRPKTTASVAWQPPNWLTEAESGPAQMSTDISAVIQEIINRPGWSSGNSLALFITGTGSRRAGVLQRKSDQSSTLAHYL